MLKLDFELPQIEAFILGVISSLTGVAVNSKPPEDICLRYYEHRQPKSVDFDLLLRLLPPLLLAYVAFKFFDFAATSALGLVRGQNPPQDLQPLHKAAPQPPAQPQAQNSLQNVPPSQVNASPARTKAPVSTNPPQQLQAPLKK